MLKLFLILWLSFSGVVLAKEYTNTSFYVAYDSADSTQFALVLPSVNKVYTHKAGQIAATDLKQIDTQFVSSPTYNNGELCFSALIAGASGDNGASVMANKCYTVNFFYTQKEEVPNVGTAFILTYRVTNKVYEGIAGDAASFKVVRDGNTTYNAESISNEDYSDFSFDVSQAKVIINVVTNDVNTIHITNDVQIESLGKATSINKTIKIDTATAKNLYILFTNDNPSSSETVQITHNAKISPAFKIASTQKTIASKKSYILPTPNHIQNFTQNIQSRLIENNISISRQFKSLSIEPSYDIAGLTTQRFYLDISSSGPFTDATARKVVSNVSTAMGSKTLNIWVSDDSFFGSGCSKAKCVTQEMVDALADIFLKAGADNDIYDWDTNIFGEEWGAAASSKYSNLIGANNEITILLTDIENDDSTNGGVLGYFYAKDNYSKESISGSNERIMFYIDAVLFANSENTTWSIDDYWPKEMISTLAHEFQHMIHFYEKNTLLSENMTDTWMNEMLSETTEEVVATKIHHTGPRGVAYTDGSAGISGNTDGRYPLFNSTNTLSLTSWGNNLQDYSKVNAFGAFLTRNYGGVKVLHDIMYNTFSDEQAVMDAVHKTVQGEGKLFGDLVREWGVAVLLSTQDNLMDMPTYNTGDFTPNTYGNSTYDLGSINFFNYNPMPTIYTTAGTVQPQANYYYKIGDNISADVDINITLPASVEATLIAR